MSTTTVTRQITVSPQSSQHADARFAGRMYFVVLGFDIAGVVIGSSIAGNGSFIDRSHRNMASEMLYRIGLCCALVGSLSTILLAIGLNVALKPAEGNLALLALVLRVAEAAIGGVGIASAFAILQIHRAAHHANAFSASQLGALANLSAGTKVSAIFFSLGSTKFFYMFVKSRYIPLVLSAWGTFASMMYAVVWFISLILPQDSTTAIGYGSVPILIAEPSPASGC